MSSKVSLTLGEIASLVGGALEGGDASTVVGGVNDLASATSDQVSFLDHPKYRRQALTTRAAALLIGLEENDQGITCPRIRVPKPSEAFGLLIERFLPSDEPWVPGIHPSACISDEVTVPASCQIGPGVVISRGTVLGERVRIEAGCFIGESVRIGDDSRLHPRVVVRERCIIGCRVILQPGAVIGSDGFGYIFRDGRHLKVPQVGIVQIDNDVEIGSNTTIDRGRFGRTWIKEGTKIDNLVMVAHNVSIGPHAIIVAQCGISGSSHLGAYVTMAGQSAVVGHVDVGDQVTLTAWTAVTKDIPEKGIYRGGPAKPMRESMKIEALTMRLPELYKRIQALEARLADGRG